MVENKATFFARLEPRYSPSDLTTTKIAYFFGKFGHRHQFRKEKDAAGKNLRYWEHPRRVALITTDEAGIWEPVQVQSSLLHDIIEDSHDIDAAILEHLFGPIVARRVIRLSKVPKEGYIERLAEADDDDLIIKACDRLDNLRSLDQTTAEFRKKQVKETMEKYLPLFMKRLPNFIIVQKIVAELAKLT